MIIQQQDNCNKHSHSKRRGTGHTSSYWCMAILKSREAFAAHSPFLGAKNFLWLGSSSASAGFWIHCFWFYRLDSWLCPLTHSSFFTRCSPGLPLNDWSLLASGTWELHYLFHVELLWSFIQPGSSLIRTKLFKYNVLSTNLMGFIPRTMPQHTSFWDWPLSMLGTQCCCGRAWF